LTARSHRSPSTVAKPQSRPDRRAGFDPSSGSRAAVAYQEEFEKWQMQIDTVYADRSLSPSQRDTAIAGLRFRQQIEAKAAQTRAADDEKQKMKSARRAARSLLKTPVTPT
jgi:hypothetical protein